MKTILMWLLAFVILYCICLLIGLISCLYDGSLAWRDGWFRVIDANGQVSKPEPYVKPTAEEVQQIHKKYQEERSSKASHFCFAALGCFFLGWLTGKPQFHTVALICLFGALVWDYKVLFAALFMWYVIVPALIVGGIIALFKRN